MSSGGAIYRCFAFTKGQRIHVQGRWKVFDSVLSYFNFSLEVLLILPLNRVCPEDKYLTINQNLDLYFHPFGVLALCLQ